METNEQTQFISVGSVPIHPGIADYKDAEGRVVVFVQDTEEGRSAFLAVELYGEMSRTWEVRYQDWENMVLKMTADVTERELLGGSNDRS